MARVPERGRRPLDARSAAEAAFKSVTTKPAIERLHEAPALPGAKELVSLKIDSEVLARFQSDGPGWQERINAALRNAVDL